ncbi:MAG: M24 family metallopeptidase [Candidatus Woesebacteria bacterium]|jgi:Xaa-Pro dipeptidase
MKSYSFRISSLQEKIKTHQAILLASASDNFYFTGFEQLTNNEREAFTIISKKQAFLIHNSFSPTPSDNKKLIKIPGCQLKNLTEQVTKIVQNEKITELLIDEDHVSVAEYKALAKIKKLKLLELDKNLTWQLRMVKDEQEIKKMIKAAQIANKVMVSIEKKFKVGISEKKLALILEERMRKLGSEKRAFPTIVAFGTNSALPHHQPTGKKLKKNMAILIDMGAVFENYCSDMTRTFWFAKKAPAEFNKIEKTVKKAYQGAISFLNQKLKQFKTEIITDAKSIDQTARSIIEKAGFKDYFIHTTGHGLGLDIHEPPSLSWKNEQAIKKNMIITIEPGIYLKDKFGYRYENTIWVGENGIEELTLSC